MNTEEFNNEVQPITAMLNYVNIPKPKTINTNIPRVPPKPIIMMHGEPSIT